MYREPFEVKLPFLTLTKKPFFSETGQKFLSFFYQIFPATIVQNALFPSRLTLSMKWFSRENVHFCCFFGLLVGKLRQGCQNNSLRWQKNNSRKWLFTSNGLILDIVISHSTKLFGFWLKISNRDVSTAFSASRLTTSGKTSFFGINYQFQFLLGFWARRVGTINKKKSGLSKLELKCPEAKIEEKMLFWNI